MAGSKALIGIGLGALVIGAAAMRRGSKSLSPAPSDAGFAPYDPWTEDRPAPSQPTQPVTPSTPAPPSGGFGGPVCDPMATPPPGFVCMSTTDGRFYLSAKDPERFNPDLSMEAQVVSAVVSEWIDSQPMEIVLCDGTVRTPASGFRVSQWLTQIAYWLAYRGLAGSPCPSNAGPEDLALIPSDPAFAEQTPFRDSWLRLNQAIKRELNRRYVSDAPL